MSDSPALTFQQYEALAGTTAKYPGRGNGALAYPVLGLNGEAGEVAEKYKKVLRDYDGDVTVQRDAMLKELGDVLWYVAACCHELGESMENVAQMNLDKLRSRANRGVISGDGDNR